MSRHVTRATIEDAEHFTPEERAAIIASYPLHERDARTKGIPQLGSGRVFPLADEAIACRPFPIPDFYRCIGGLDFGWDHPTAAVLLAYDPDGDCMYVAQAYRKREATPIIHAAALKAWGENLRFAWPHDGLQHDKQSGKQLALSYREAGLRLLPEHAKWRDGGIGVEAGLMEMLDRMQTNRLKVFEPLGDWFDEFRLYHRVDGKPVKEYDDLISATRYAIMCIGQARPLERKRPRGPVFAEMTDDPFA